MIQENALDIILDLARQNTIDDPDLEDEKKDQEEAIKIVEKISSVLFGGDIAHFGSKKNEGYYKPKPILDQLKEAQISLGKIQRDLLIVCKKIGKAYSKKHNIDADEFTCRMPWSRKIELYKSGARLDDTWTLKETIEVPEWAFDDPDKYIKEEL